MAKNLAEQEAEARKLIQQGKARLADLRRKKAEDARKRDTRLKIIIGGMLVNRALNGSAAARSLIDEAIKVSERDDDRNILSAFRNTLSETQKPPASSSVPETQEPQAGGG